MNTEWSTNHQQQCPLSAELESEQREALATALRVLDDVPARLRTAASIWPGKTTTPLQPQPQWATNTLSIIPAIGTAFPLTLGYSVRTGSLCSFVRSVACQPLSFLYFTANFLIAFFEIVRLWENFGLFHKSKSIPYLLRQYFTCFILFLPSK